MNAVVSIVLLAAVLGVIVFLLSRRENGRRSQYGPAGLSEFRTGLALDECKIIKINYKNGLKLILEANIWD